ncbi:unnamed protein product [Symbiodinium sp. CCMP2592]|nr:unnamed protein product [Symbiodinium sp. CCMP2592]
MQSDPQSPQPKKRGAPDEEKLSLEAIREVVRSEVGGSTAALRAEIGQRMDRVETGVTAQLEKTLERLAALETKVQVLQTTGTASTTDTDAGSRKPALIMGGWSDDSPADETLAKMKQIVKDLRLDICTEQAFVPGVRRGYAIIPYSAKEGEDPQQLRDRLTGALRRVRQANVQMGAHADGKAKYLWLQLSQSPERRTEPTESGGEGGQDDLLELEFHVPFRPPKGEQRRTFNVATWNVGGLSAANALEMLQAFGGNKALSSVAVVLFQEVITEAGRHFASNKSWVLVYGKLLGEWRGEGVAFRAGIGTHTATQVLRAGVATIITTLRGRSGACSAHTCPTTPAQAIMLQWGTSRALRSSRAVIGIDANEQFTASPHTIQQERAQGHTGRGENILAWLQHHTMRLPPQDLGTPSHFPYDSTQEPRRLDYVAIRGVFSVQGEVLAVRDMARSDHEPVVLQLRADAPKLAKPKGHCGPRHVHLEPEQLQATLEQEATVPPGDRHGQIAHVSQLITKPGRSKQAKFEESPELKRARRAAHATAPGQERRQAWKGVHKRLQAEHKQWKQAMADRASQHDWPAYRQHKKGAGGDQWMAALTDNHDWQGALLAHFKSIFHKADGGARDADFEARRQRLCHRCKVTPWLPFTSDELQGVAGRWKNSKSTGPDHIAHEALHALRQHPVWEHRLREMLNEALYMGSLPAAVERGLTVLLPKEAIAQLLLRRCAYTLKPHNALQWASPGRQGTELILTLRKVARQVLQTWSNDEWELITHGFHIDGEWVTPESGDAALTVLGSPVSFQGGPPQLAAEMGTRARKAWGKNKALLTAKTKLKQRLQLHSILVRQSALWAAETWPVQDTLLRAANVQQLQHVRSMVGGARAPGEAWADWNKRSLRMVRVHLHQNKVERWSTYILRMIWGVWGHVARAQDVTYEMLLWRGMDWWWQQQALPDTIGARHASRFNSSLDTERHIAAVAGAKWGEVARDRLAWGALEERFVEAHDPPWCSGKQAQLQNLAQTRQDGRRAKAIKQRRQARRAANRLLD